MAPSALPNPDWQPAYERLQERFPQVAPAKIVQVLKECEGHAGSTAAKLREMTSCNVKEADEDDIEHVSTLLSSPAMFKHACGEQFKKFDRNGDGVLDWSEVLAMILDLYNDWGLEPPNEGSLQAFFHATDDNTDGVLSEREFRRFFEMFLRYAYFDVQKLRELVEQGQQKVAAHGGVIQVPPTTSPKAKTPPTASPKARESKREASNGATRSQSGAVPARQKSPPKEVPQSRRDEDRSEKHDGMALRCIAPSSVPHRARPDFSCPTDAIVNPGEAVRVTEVWMKTTDGTWLPMIDSNGQALFRISKSGLEKNGKNDRTANASHGSEEEPPRRRTPEKKNKSSRGAEVAAEGGGGSGGGLRPGEEEWQGAFERLCERFPDTSKDLVAQALRDHGGHAGKAANTLRG